LDGTLEGKRPLRPRQDGRIILEWVLRETRREGVDWIYVAQDGDYWWALVSTVMNL
jgi:hypothetical protein